MNSLDELINFYKLSDEEHRVIFEKLKRELFSEKNTVSIPSAMFVIGQPGSGKTTFIRSIALSNYIIINSDEYRKFCKFSDVLSTNYTKLTNHDVHLWGDELFSYGIDNGYSVLREKVPVNDSLLGVFRELSGKCDLSVCVVVAGNLTSLLRTRERYERELSENKTSKLSNIDSHNKCYDILPEFISRCLELGVKVSYAIPVGNGFQVVSVGNDCLTLLDQIRNSSNEATCSVFVERVNHIKDFMNARGASQDQFDELARIEGIYKEFVKLK